MRPPFTYMWLFFLFIPRGPWVRFEDFFAGFLSANRCHACSKMTLGREKKPRENLVTLAL
jgi:hypothetical protein